MYESIFLDCACYTKEHLVRLDYFDDPDEPKLDTLELSFVLNHYVPWYKRLYFAVRYVLKLDQLNVQSHYAGWMLNLRDVDRFIEYLEKYRDNRDKSEQYND